MTLGRSQRMEGVHEKAEGAQGWYRYDVHSRCTLGAPSLMLLYFRLPLEDSDGYKDARLAAHSKKTAHTKANTNHKMACGDGFGSPNRGWICPD